ncbi:MAG: HAD family hydrolase [Anaerolineae bacterium]
MTFLYGTLIEIIHERVARGQIKHALFDFDGTLSLIRQGWQQVMKPLMLEVLSQTPRHEPQDELKSVISRFIDRTTGVQTIYQMMGLADLVRERGAEPLDPKDYKRIYLERLWQHIAHRVSGLKDGSLVIDDYLLPGSEDLLDELQKQGITCYLASGTDVEYVRDEAATLGLARYFGGGIYGALENLEDYSKEKVIADILRSHHLQGSGLVTFGDGYVEIENTVAAGGLAVGVASDESHPGQVDNWKRERLVQAGAQIIVPDFASSAALLAYLLDF